MNNQQQQRSFFFNVDWTIVLVYLALCTIGWLNIHSAVFDEKHPGFMDLDTNYGKQFVFIIIGIVTGIVILLLESRFFSALAPVFYGITVVLLVVVLIVGRNVGVTRHGYRWVGDSGFNHRNWQNLALFYSWHDTSAGQM